MAIDEKYFYGAYGIDIEKARKEIYDGALKYKKDDYSIDNIFTEIEKSVQMQKEKPLQINGVVFLCISVTLGNHRRFATPINYTW